MLEFQRNTRGIHRRSVQLRSDMSARMFLPFSCRATYFQVEFCFVQAGAQFCPEPRWGKTVDRPRSIISNFREQSLPIPAPFLL